jgi:DNA invertase Pin-like site-specific DNA recombinase
VLLLEELARVGVDVCFAKEPERGGTPGDELLRQFQGMIAEYERAQIAERTRRGKLHRARSGSQAVMSGASYGYRYVKKRPIIVMRTGKSTSSRRGSCATCSPAMWRRAPRSASSLGG